MYAYIMERTQIYLTRREKAALERAAGTTGRTRSQLIREAIEARYLSTIDDDVRLAVLSETAGLWSDRSETGEAYVEALRQGRLATLHDQD